ncbi:MAG: hypothetical protein AAFN79_20295 [Pseudomonadota bacterium]
MKRSISFALAALTASFGGEVAANSLDELGSAAFCVPSGVNDAYVIDRKRLACAAIHESTPKTIRSAAIASCIENTPAKESAALFLGIGKYDNEFFELAEYGQSGNYSAKVPANCPEPDELTGDMLFRSSCIPIRCETFEASADPEKKLPPQVSGGFRLRETRADLAAPSLKKANPARLSYLADFEGDEETLSFKGVFGYAFTGFARRDAEDRDFIPFTLTPYVGADLIERDDPTKEDVRNIFTGFDANIVVTDDILFRGAHSLTMDGRLITDDEADSLIADAAFTYQPVPAHDVFLLGTDLRPVRLVLSPSASAEFGQVFDAGDRTDVEDDDTYLRLGGGVQARIFPNAIKDLEGFSVGASYIARHSFLGPEDSYERFEAELRYIVPSSQNFGFSLKYVNGDVETTLENEEALHAAFTVRF